MIFICVKRSKLTKGIGILGMLLFAIFFVAITQPGKGIMSLNPHRKLPIYSVDTKEKKIAITFDASWGQDNTDKILEILDKYEVKATFFLVGAWIDAHADTLKSINDKGHDIGNHTNRHPDMKTISRDKLLNEIAIADSKIMKITGKGTDLFRCPSGEYNDLIIDTVNSTNRFCIQWDVDSIDWKGEGADIEYERVIKKTKPGSIILFHNEAPNTPYNLTRIIEYFKNQGYEFVKVSDLIYKDNYYIDYSGKQIYNKND